MEIISADDLWVAWSLRPRSSLPNKDSEPISLNDLNVRYKYISQIKKDNGAKRHTAKY